MLVCGRYSITAESDGGRAWFRFWLGSSVVADKIWSEVELERELARYGLTLDDFAEAVADGGDGCDGCE